jgi:hypothetical protein
MTSLDKSEDLQSLRHIKLSAMIRNKQMMDQYILGPARTLEDQEIPLHPSSLQELVPHALGAGVLLGLGGVAGDLRDICRGGGGVV